VYADCRCNQQVDREFVEDNFNLYGLRALVPHYNEALDMILDIERMEETPSDDRQVPTAVCMAACGNGRGARAGVTWQGGAPSRHGRMLAARGGRHRSCCGKRLHAHSSSSSSLCVLLSLAGGGGGGGGWRLWLVL
jgi:hypothetical protein